MHICIGNLTITGSDNGLLSGRLRCIIWTNARILLNGPIQTNISEILIKIIAFSFQNMCLKVSSAKRRPFCLCLNVLSNLCFDNGEKMGRLQNGGNLLCNLKTRCCDMWKFLIDNIIQIWMRAEQNFNWIWNAIKNIWFGFKVTVTYL